MGLVVDYDLVVVGAGTGNYVLAPELAGLRTAIVEPSRFGGTCLNRGCIPSKMFVVAADAARSVGSMSRLGVSARLEAVDWPAIRDRVFGRIGPLHDRAVEHRRNSGVAVYLEAARFVGPRVLRVGEETVSGARMVLAAGSRPVVPKIPGLDAVDYHTSDTVMRLERLPASMLIVGGGFIAAEMGHAFSAFGTEVTIVQRGPRLLMGEDEAISTRFTDVAGRYLRVRVDSAVESVAPAAGGGVAVTVSGPDGSHVVEAEVLLLATGRRPNTDLLRVGEAGIEVDEHGHVVTDATGATTAEGVWSLGDLANHFQLKHMANAEARVITHNLLHPGRQRELPTGLAPHAVFADPQVASVGLTEQQARAQGRDPVVAVRDYADTAYGWALEDEHSFVKLVADPDTRLLLGAHVIGPDAALLIQPLLQGMMLGSTVDQMAREVLYIHPALSEVVEQALLAL